MRSKAWTFCQYWQKVAVQALARLASFSFSTCFANSRLGGVASKSRSSYCSFPARWICLQAKACAVRHRNLESLKAPLRRAWDEIDEDYLRVTVDSVPRHLQRCIRANRDIFEWNFLHLFLDTTYVFPINKCRKFPRIESWKCLHILLYW